jgi:uncharacterized protein YndB with AHSA1/START domain
MIKDIKQSIFFSSPLQDVWDYLTKPELMEQWLAKNDFLPIIGHKFQFRGDAGITYCEVLEIIPLQKLSYSWKHTKGKINRTVDSIVVWTPVEKNNGTELGLEHSGFKLPEDYISHNNGWAECIQKFSELLVAIKKNIKIK